MTTPAPATTTITDSNDSSPKIEVSVEDFRRTHSPLLILLLRAIRAAGPNNGIPTKWLCDNVLNSRGHGMAIIKQARQSGYITTYEKHKPRGQKGHYLLLNKLTPKGKKLVEILDSSSSYHNNNDNKQ